jgi:dienelactone hydrolase
MMRRPIAACFAVSFALLLRVDADAAQEAHPGVTTSYEMLTLRDGAKVQLIVTKPANARGRLPAIQFVQWLSCDTVAISDDPKDGWSAMLRRLARESHVLVQRMEKRGVGASPGDCASLDYETELADHREAFEALKRRPEVDPARIVIYGGSIGATYAPLLAADEDVAGVMVWGGGATTWAERMLAFERHALELRGEDPAQLAAEMTARYRYFLRYLIDGETPSQIAASDPKLGAVWRRIVGTSANGHYGRPFAFHQQAQRADWAGAWSRVRAPVLVMYGEYDWFESRDAAFLIARIVNAKSPGRATFVEIPRMDHHFSFFPSAEEAFRGTTGRVGANAAVGPMLEWLAKTVRAGERS